MVSGPFVAGAGIVESRVIDLLLTQALEQQARNEVQGLDLLGERLP